MKHIIWSCPGAHVEPKASCRQMLTEAPSFCNFKENLLQSKGSTNRKRLFQSLHKIQFWKVPRTTFREAFISQPSYGERLYGTLSAEASIWEPVYGSVCMGGSLYIGNHYGNKNKSHTKKHNTNHMGSPTKNPTKDRVNNLSRLICRLAPGILTGLIHVYHYLDVKVLCSDNGFASFEMFVKCSMSLNVLYDFVWVFVIKTITTIKLINTVISIVKKHILKTTKT